VQKLRSLSIFLPAYNEASNIEEAVRQAIDVAQEAATVYEVIVIDDGSIDATRTIALRVAKELAHVRVITQKNRGYGGALKRGFAEAKHEWIFFTDSDLQFDVKELLRFVKHTKKNHLILGYRKNRAEGWKRQTIANLLKIWNFVFLNFPQEIKDIDCAFKLIHKEVIEAVKPLESDGAMISTELLLKTLKHDFSYTQLGVRHFQRRAGSPTGSSIKVIAKAVRDTFLLQKFARPLFSKTSYWLASSNS
jgi:glycosyltransferase involved in cell wall biosynthesis